MIKAFASSLIKCIFNSCPLSHQGPHFVSFFFSFFLTTHVLWSLSWREGSCWGSLEIYSQVFFYQREPHTNPHTDRKGCFTKALFQEGEKKVSGLKTFCPLLRLCFERNFCYLLNKITVIKTVFLLSASFSLFWYLLWKTFKACPLNCSGMDPLNASKLSRTHGGKLECLTFHVHTRMWCTYKPTHIYAHAHTTINRQKIDLDSWIFDIWGLEWFHIQQLRGPKFKQLALSCSPITLILMFKQIQSICRWHCILAETTVSGAQKAF